MGQFVFGEDSLIFCRWANTIESYRNEFPLGILCLPGRRYNNMGVFEQNLRTRSPSINADIILDIAVGSDLYGQILKMHRRRIISNRPLPAFPPILSSRRHMLPITSILEYIVLNV